jgi:hypothetical protein
VASLLLSLSVVFDFALVCDWVSHRGPFQRYQRTHECGDLLNVGIYSRADVPVRGSRSN